RRFPADLRGERVELHPVFGDDPWKLDRDVLGPQDERAPLVARLETAGEPRDAGNALLRPEGEPAKAPAHVVTLRIVRIAGPARLQVVHGAAWIALREARPNGGRERKVFRQPRKRREVDRIGLDLATGGGPLSVRETPPHAKVRRRNHDAGIGPERHLAAGDL